MNKKPKVLFLSIRDSVRGQMAEGFLRALEEDRFIATSGGIESPRLLHWSLMDPLVETGIPQSARLNPEQRAEVCGGNAGRVNQRGRAGKIRKRSGAEAGECDPALR